MKTPIVSVVIITYNGLPFLPKALHSVLAQTVTDIEVIVVEDGSRDGSEAYVSSVRDPRIRYLWRPNGGPNAARNTGWRAARADLIAFLDVDDWWGTDKLENQLGALARDQGAGAVHSSAYIVSQNDTSARPWIELATDSGDMSSKLLFGNFIAGSASSVLVRKEALRAIDGFDETIRFAEDWDTWIRLSEVCAFACSEPADVYILKRPGSHGQQTEQSRIASHRVVSRAFRRRGTVDRTLIQEVMAEVDYHACLDFTERGFRRDAIRTVGLAIKRRPRHLIYWKRLMLLCLRKH